MKNYAVLMFSDHPEDRIPYAYTELIIDMFGTKRKMESKVFKGAVWKQYYAALEYINNNFLNELVIRDDGNSDNRKIENFTFIALEELLAKHPESRFLKQLEAVSGAKESADEILAANDSPVVAPDDFGRDFIKLIQGIYEETELSTFADIMYRLWGTLPDGIKNTEPFITLCYADDPLSCGEEAQTRRIYRNLFQYYDSHG